MREFDPIEHFMNYLRLWWLILVAALLGGLAGFLFSRAHAPVYEAIAIYMVTIDPDIIEQETLDMYDKDIALSATYGALISPDVINYVLSEAARLGQNTEYINLIANTSFERRHAFWELRFRSSDPEFAQTLVNLWAEKGYQAMLKSQVDGATPAYVIFSPPSPAGRPEKPIYFGTNKLVMAGSAIGWLVGLLGVELAGQRFLSRIKS